MATYIQIGSTVTVGAGGASSITFSSIPATYTDLVVKASLRTNRSDGILFDNCIMTFNGSTSGYSGKLLYGLSGSATSINAGGSSSISFIYATSSYATSNTFGNTEIYIPNYAGSTNKSVSVDGVSESNDTAAITALSASLWSNTAAINQITIGQGTGTFVQYSTATLYGISKS